MCLSTYVCVRVYVCMFICMYKCVCTYVWRPEVKVRCLFQCPLTIFFFLRSLIKTETHGFGFNDWPTSLSHLPVMVPPVLKFQKWLNMANSFTQMLQEPNSGSQDCTASLLITYLIPSLDSLFCLLIFHYFFSCCSKIFQMAVFLWKLLFSGCLVICFSL